MNQPLWKITKSMFDTNVRTARIRAHCCFVSCCGNKACAMLSMAKSMPSMPSCYAQHFCTQNQCVFPPIFKASCAPWSSCDWCYQQVETGAGIQTLWLRMLPTKCPGREFAVSSPQEVSSCCFARSIASLGRKNASF